MNTTSADWACSLYVYASLKEASVCQELSRSEGEIKWFTNSFLLETLLQTLHSELAFVGEFGGKL